MTVYNEETSRIGYLIGFIFIISTILNGAITAVITISGRTPEYGYIGTFNIICILIELVLVFFGSNQDNNKLIYTGIILGLTAQIIIIPSLIIKLDYLISQNKLLNFMMFIIVFIDLDVDSIQLLILNILFILDFQSFRILGYNRVTGVVTNIVVAIIGLIINLIGTFKHKIWKHIQFILERNFPSNGASNLGAEGGIERSYRYRRPVAVPQPPSMPSKISSSIYTPTSPKTLICPFCGKKNPETFSTCISCLNNLPKCFICNRSISAEQIVYCPFCNITYHKVEFFEWLKVKAFCKNCNKELDLWEFQKYSEKYEHIEEISSIKCPKCKKFIPNDSNFCIFCGVSINDHK